MAKKKIIEIDPDLLAASKKYVEDQFTIMRAHGSVVSVLTPTEYDQIVYDCARAPQVIRNWNKKLAKRKKKLCP